MPSSAARTSPSCLSFSRRSTATNAVGATREAASVAPSLFHTPHFPFVFLRPRPRFALIRARDAASVAFRAFPCPPRAATRTLSRLRRLRSPPAWRLLWTCQRQIGGRCPCPPPAPAPHKVAQDPTPRRQHTPTPHALIILNRARACRHTHTDPRARARAKQQQQHTHTHKQVCTRAHVPARDGRPGCRGRRAGVDRWGPDGGSAAMYRVV